MTRFLANLIGCLKKSNKPRPVARDFNRARLSLEALEERWAPSTLRGVWIAGAPSIGSVGIYAAADDIVVGAGAGAPGGHVKV